LGSLNDGRSRRGQAAAPMQAFESVDELAAKTRFNGFTGRKKRGELATIQW